jgi:dihydropteroate synthase
MDYTLNVKGRLLDFAEPQVMGILNVTPDSFYADSRAATKQAVAERARQIIAEGGNIIDVGACSTRPDSSPVSQEEETSRLRMALRIVRQELPDAVVSVDTFRPDVASMAVEEFGVDIINDISGGSAAMFRMVARQHVPYILTSQQPTLRDMLLDFAEKVQQLRDYGQHDIIIDPGFGFGKSLDENYAVLRQLEQLWVKSTLYFWPSTAATSSLVVVLPLVPVMPMTGIWNWRRCSRASSLKVWRQSSTGMRRSCSGGAAAQPTEGASTMA